MPCNLVIQSARYGYNSGSLDMWADVTATVSQLLAAQFQQNRNMENFNFALTAASVGQLAPPSGVTPALAVTFYWQERGSSWTCTSSWAVGQTVKIPVNTPPQILSAVYSSPNVTFDITSRFQSYVSLHSGSGFSISVGSPDFLRALFGTVIVSGSPAQVDPDAYVLKTLYLKYSQIANGAPQTYETVATDGQSFSIV